MMMRPQEDVQTHVMPALPGTYQWRQNAAGQWQRVPVIAWSVTVFTREGRNHPAGEPTCAHPVTPGIPPIQWEAIQYPDGTVDDERLGQVFISVAEWQRAREVHGGSPAPAPSVSAAPVPAAPVPAAPVSGGVWQRLRGAGKAG